MKSIKQINIKNGPYHFFDDMINITNFDPNLVLILLFTTLDISQLQVLIVKIFVLI